MPAVPPTLIDAIEIAWPFDRWSEHPVLVAVSGGPDSVVLLHAIHAIASNRPCELHIGHINHGLRESADKDHDLVEAIAKDLAFPFHARRLDLSLNTSRQGEGLEGIARKARYAALRSMAIPIGARTVATAHTRDDQVETLLFRLLRGSGIAGLRGMPTFRELAPGLTLARPMLQVTRAEVMEYIGTHNLEFTHDESNDELAFARNLIRNKVLPTLREQFPWPIDESLLNLSDSAREYENFVQQAARDAEERIVCRKTESSIHIGAQSFARLPAIVQRTILRNLWQQQNWPEQQMNRDAWYDLSHAITRLTDTRRETPDPHPVRRCYPGNIQLKQLGDTIEIVAGDETLS